MFKHCIRTEILNVWKFVCVYTVQEKVIANERQRRKERLTGARGNNVWTYRTVPPESFSRPLPEHMLRNAVPSLLDKSTENSCLIS